MSMWPGSNLPDTFTFQQDDSLPPVLEGPHAMLRLPEFVQPQELFSSSPDTFDHFTLMPDPLDSSNSAQDLTPGSDWSEPQQPLEPLSPPATRPSDGSYRPRKATSRRKKRNPGRIEPRSDDHARKLELNRTAAARCRNRQKTFVQQLQQRCKQEEEKLRVQNSTVSALRNEVLALRLEVIRQSVCDCHPPSVPR
jgi:hypothetical protein